MWWLLRMQQKQALFFFTHSYFLAEVSCWKILAAHTYFFFFSCSVSKLVITQFAELAISENLSEISEIFNFSVLISRLLTFLFHFSFKLVGNFETKSPSSWGFEKYCWHFRLVTVTDKFCTAVEKSNKYSSLSSHSWGNVLIDVIKSLIMNSDLPNHFSSVSIYLLHRSNLIMFVHLA